MSNAEKVIRLHNELMGVKTNFTTFFQEVTDYILPYASNTRQWQTPGTRRGAERYDSTAAAAAERLAASLGTTLTNASMKWFLLQFEDDELNEAKEATDWLEESTNIMYAALGQSNFYSQIDEAFLDIVGYGTTAMMGMNRGLSLSKGFNGLVFEALPIREYVFVEGQDGQVNELLRSFQMTPLQALERFGALPGFKGLGESMSKALADAQKKLGSVQKAYEGFEIVHHIYPRRDRDPIHPAARNFPWGSTYVAKKDKHVLWESGFMEKPFGLGRWRKNADDSGWGRGPGLTAMPTIRSLNEFSRIMLKAANKDVDPPLLVEHKGVIGSVRTSASGITYKRRGAEIDYLQSGSKFNFAAAELADLRRAVHEMFFTEQLNVLTGEPTPNMTAFEFGRRLDMMRQMLGSTFGRLQQELLDPLMLRTFSIMLRSRRLPPPPESLGSSLNLKVEYVGPLARAQKANDVDAIHQAYQFGAMIAQTTGSVDALDIIDDQRAQRHVSQILGVPADLLRSEEEARERSEARAQAQEEAAALAQAEQAAGAVQKVGSVAA